MSKINMIWQPYGDNILIIEYKSGVKRYAYLDGDGYRLTRTQREFMKNAVRFDYVTSTEWR